MPNKKNQQNTEEPENIVPEKPTFSKKIKKLLKKKSLWAVLIIVAAIVAAIFYFNQPPEIEYVTEKVQQGDLKQTVSETGTVQAASEIDLNFKANGTIEEINVKEGDEVKKGDVLAKLDDSEVQIQIRQAQASLASAQANLDILIAGASPEDVKVTEESVASAKVTYDNAVRDYDTIKLKLETEIKSYEQTIADKKDNLLTAITSALTKTEHSLDQIQVLFDNDDLEKVFSARNSQYEIDAVRYHSRAVNSYVPDAKNSLIQAKTTLLESDVINAYEKCLQALDTAELALDNTFAGLTATPAYADYPESVLEADKTIIKTEQITNDTSLSSVKAGFQAYENAKLNLESAQKNKQVQLENAQSAIDSSLAAWNQAKAQLELKKAPARQTDISYYRSQVSQQYAALESVRKKLDDYIIYAPIDGEVIFVNYEVGEQVGFGITDITEAATAVITMIGESQFEIEVDVPESDIVKVTEGQDVEITLDAYGEDYVFPGKVSFVDIAETVIQDVIYYKVKVEIDQVDLEIKSGMTANVDIMTAMRKNVLFIPNRAIKISEQGFKYVEILEGEDSVVRKEVETGLRGDDGIEIISGLTANDNIILFTREVD